MTDFVVCIACLGTNVKMVPLINPIHSEFFVKLADFKPTVGDTNHDMLCYICFSQLQRCHRFINMSRKAQGILQQLRHYGSQLTQCTVAAMKEKPTNSFVISSIKSFDKIFSEETVESNPSAQDIKPIIITPMHKIKEEYLEITDVEEEDPVTVKEEEPDNDVGFSMEKQQPHVNESKGDSKVAHLINQLKSTIQAHIDNSKMGNGIHPLLAPTNISSKVKESSLLQPLKRKYIKKKIKVKKMFMCNDCGKSFTCRGYLERHLRVHTGEKPFTCENCNRKFAQQSHLTQHMRQHTGEKPYSCHVCKNKSFNHQYNYKTHMRKHFGEKTHKCELCIAKFHQKSDLQRHILSHTGEKPYSCNFCQTKFTQKCHMTKHVKDFHDGAKVDEFASTLDDKNIESSQAILPKKVIKQFTCTYAQCLKIFQRQGALFNHINRIHLGVPQANSFFCVKCQKKFTKKTHLKKHACELKSKDRQKVVEVIFENHDLQKNEVKCELEQKKYNKLHQDLNININEGKILYPPNNEEEYIIP